MSENQPNPLFSPEGALMITIAVFIDLFDFAFEFFPGLGSIGSLLLNITAVIFFGAWLFLRGKVFQVPASKTGQKIEKAGAEIKKEIGAIIKRAGKFRWLLRPLIFILEFIPLVSALPLWTWLVYSELKSS